MAGNSAEPLRERLRIAVFATGANLGAAAQGIPRRVSPFDF
jgi:hypothetical protein